MCDVTVSDAKTVLPFVALSGVTAPMDSNAVDLNGVSDDFTVAWWTTGGATGVNLTLQGSHDGVNWFGLVSGTTGANGVLSNKVVDPSAQTFRHLARYVRVHLVSITGGTSPTLTATVGVGKVH